MSENPLRQLEACGVSVWNDNIRRSWVANGELKKLVDEDGLRGVTSNPTIFEKAIGGSSDYDDSLRELVDEGLDAEGIFRRLAVTDIGMGADVLRSVYDATDGHDGFISIEVSPQAAHDTAKTLEDAHYYWKALDRPNIMIKVPATAEGLPAIRQLISEGINVNITLIFAVEVYEQVMDAYLSGLEARVEAGKPIERISSVASFFVSRVDTLVDDLLEKTPSGASAKDEAERANLVGKAAVANAKIAYQLFQKVFSSPRFEALRAKSAQVQRPLWASTSTKNPNFKDTMYVESLVGEQTVNTMPPQTIVAVRDHGHIECGTLTQDVDGAHEVVASLGRVGINMTDVTGQLTVEGVQKFVDSLDALYAVIATKSDRIIAGEVAHESASLDGQQPAVDASFERMDADDFVSRLWRKDPTLWKPNPSEQSEITDRLGWLHVSDCMQENLQRFKDLAAEVSERGYTHAVVLGMGGSSLAPYVLAESFGRREGFPNLLVLDSTDPDAVRAIEREIDISTTLFLVSTKSGGTTETLSFFKTFWQMVKERCGDAAGEQFLAITDPGTSLEQLAREHGFKHTFLNPADIGGRYSAMSYFGLVPAAVAGIDVASLIDHCLQMEHACAPSVPIAENPGAWLGTIMADLARVGRNKVTFFASEPIQSLGLWLEQLLAESTGKEGKGLVPVLDDPAGEPDAYGDDHLFVAIQLKGSHDEAMDTRLNALERAGQPIVRLDMDEMLDLGGEFFRWEFATAVAGAQLGINAFDQPNVQESKDNTKRVLTAYERGGSLPDTRPLATEDGTSVYANKAAREIAGNAKSVADVLSAYFGALSAPQYLAIMTYMAPSTERDAELASLRVDIRDARRVAVTLGYGPRFLHSTGQLHKGGPPEGIFLQIVADAGDDLRIPGEPYSYQTLIKAQFLGDFESLEQHGRPALRLQLKDQSPSSLRKLRETVASLLRSTQAAAH